MRVFALLLPLFLSAACHSVRTVYDEDGNVVEEPSAPNGRESSLQDRMDKHFDALFREKKNAEGVPVASSKKRSRYDAMVKKARTLGENDAYASKGFATRESLYSGSVFGGSRREYAGRKAYDGIREAPYNTNLRPDFMNDSRGIAHTEYREGGRRSMMDGQAADEAGQSYATHESRYAGLPESGYIETRRDRAPEPKIINHRDYSREEVSRLRQLLGKDN